MGYGRSKSSRQRARPQTAERNGQRGCVRERFGRNPRIPHRAKQTQRRSGRVRIRGHPARSFAHRRENRSRRISSRGIEKAQSLHRSRPRHRHKPDLCRCRPSRSRCSCARCHRFRNEEVRCDFLRSGHSRRHSTCRDGSRRPRTVFRARHARRAETCLSVRLANLP